MDFGDYRAKKVGDREIYLPERVLQSDTAITKQKTENDSLQQEDEAKKIKFPKLYPHYLLKGFLSPVFDERKGMYTAEGYGERKGQKVGYIPVSTIPYKRMSKKLAAEGMGIIERINKYLSKKDFEKGFWMNLSYPIINQRGKLEFPDPDQIDDKANGRLFFGEINWKIKECVSEFDKENKSCLLSRKHYTYAMIYGIMMREKWFMGEIERFGNYSQGSFLAHVLNGFDSLAEYFDDAIEMNVKGLKNKPEKEEDFSLIRSAKYVDENSKNYECYKHHIYNKRVLYEPTGIPVNGRIPILVEDDDYVTMRPLIDEFNGTESCHTFYGNYYYKGEKSFLLGYEE